MECMAIFASLLFFSVRRSMRSCSGKGLDIWWEQNINNRLIDCRSVSQFLWCIETLIPWGRVTHICVSNLTSIGSDNGLSPDRRQAIIWTNAGILLTGPLGTNFNEILIGIQKFSFNKMHFEVSSAKWRPFCLGLNVLISKNWEQTLYTEGTHGSMHMQWFDWEGKIQVNLQPEIL